MSEKPRFRVNTKSFIGHTLVEEGDETTYVPPEGGHVSENLSPLNDAAQALVDAQDRDHPDKAVHAKSKAAKRAAEREAAAALEKEAADGKVKAPKGDTRSTAGNGAPAAKAKDDDIA